MAGSVNKVILVGNLGKDPEVRRLGSGEPVVNLRIATSETWRDKTSGEKLPRALDIYEHPGYLAVVRRLPFKILWHCRVIACRISRDSV